MRTKYVDWEGELAVIEYDDHGYPVETAVYRAGRWTQVHWSELLFKVKEATPQQVKQIKQLRLHVA